MLDGLIVLGRTLAMLRAIARIYGVRPGSAATVSLLRRTLRNVVAAGVGELVSDAAVETLGASLLAFLSTRAGQGVLNGVLAARLGLSAMQLLPAAAVRRGGAAEPEAAAQGAVRVSGRFAMVQQRADRIVDAAIALAEERGWENVRLYLVAERLGVGLDAIGRGFRDLDAIANAWFARARRQLLRLPAEAVAGKAAARAAACRDDDLVRSPGAAPRGDRRRCCDAKLYPSHPHHWVPMIFDLSRLMHDFLDVARIASTGRRRQLAEVGLTRSSSPPCGTGGAIPSAPASVWAAASPRRPPAGRLGRGRIRRSSRSPKRRADGILRLSTTARNKPETHVFASLTIPGQGQA